MKVRIKSVTVDPYRASRPCVRYHHMAVVENGEIDFAMFALTQSEINIETRSYRLRYERTYVQ